MQRVTQPQSADESGPQRTSETRLDGSVPTVLDDRRLRWIVGSVGAYVAASLIANVMSIRAVSILGWAVDAGTLTYPLTFTLRDMIHKSGGVVTARVAIAVTAALNVVMAAALWLAAALPPDLSVGPQREFGAVLNTTWRIVAASVVAQVLAELLDTEVYQRFVRAFGQRLQYGRVLASNAVSVPVDSITFVIIAFGGVFPRSVLVEIIIANIVIKATSSLATAPLIYLVPNFRTDEPAAARTG